MRQRYSTGLQVQSICAPILFLQNCRLRFKQTIDPKALVQARSFIMVTLSTFATFVFAEPFLDMLEERRISLVYLPLLTGLPLS
jgi:hypothetical protein